jgi:hypothetical protein
MFDRMNFHKLSVHVFCLAEKAKLRRTNSRTNCQQNKITVSPLMVALENITENGAWFANLAGGIPLIQLDITTNGSLILSPFPFLPHIFSGLNQGRILLREVVVGLRPPPWLLQQPRLVPQLVAQ